MGKQNIKPSLSIADSIFKTNIPLSISPLDASKVSVSLTDNPIPLSIDTPTSTKTHTDHILTVAWTATHAWATPEINAYINLSLPPTASVLRYTTACFEGMKLYRGYDGKLRLFRPLGNCRRLLDSATRISLPAFEPEELLKLIKVLCRIDGPPWLPVETGKGSALYIRSAMIGVDADLGFHVPQEVLLYVIITQWLSSPAPVPGNRGKAKSSGVRLLANTERHVRAWPGGTENAKVAAN